jgi:3'(2'), 5'-bisphosphate nucleotidase
MTTDPGTADDARLAQEIAAEAGRRLLALRGSYESGGEGQDAAAGRTSRLRDAADRLSHEYITAELARRRPHDAVLSEEGPAPRGQPARQTADRVWIVDPLDGTREFGETGRTDWAVHVALWERGELTAGAVALPAQGVTLSTLGAAPNGGAQADGDAAVTGPARKPFRIVVSRTRRPEIAERLAEVLGSGTGAEAELVPLGSAGAKVAAVLAGQADAYVHAGGFYEWDTAAPVAVARSAGFHASRLDGGPLRFNQEDVWMPDILVCPSALAGTLLDAIATVRSGHVPGDASAIG